VSFIHFFQSGHHLTSQREAKKSSCCFNFIKYFRVPKLLSRIGNPQIALECYGEQTARQKARHWKTPPDWRNKISRLCLYAGGNDLRLFFQRNSARHFQSLTAKGNELLLLLRFFWCNLKSKELCIDRGQTFVAMNSGRLHFLWTWEKNEFLFDRLTCIYGGIFWRPLKRRREKRKPWKKSWIEYFSWNNYILSYNMICDNILPKKCT